MSSWTPEKIADLPSDKVRTLYRNAARSSDPQSLQLRSLIEESGALTDEKGGLPFDHPIMLRIQEICSEPEAVSEAIAAAEKGVPALAGMEHRIVAALGDQYGGHYTTHHAGRCIAEELTSRGWSKAGQRPMPEGTVARSATVFKKKDR